MTQNSDDTTGDENGSGEIGEGVLEITEKGYGFLRQPKNQYRATPGDVFVGKDFVRHGGLRTGLMITGKVVPPSKKKGGPKLHARGLRDAGCAASARARRRARRAGGTAI